MFKICRNFGGHFGQLVRYILLKSLAAHLGDNVGIDEGVIIYGAEKLCIGTNVSINANCFIDARGGISIADNVSIATQTIMISHSHTWGDDSIPIKYNPVVFLPIEIKDDVWIGCDVKIIGPCQINRRSIVAAGAVVKGNIEEHTIVGGVPARVIKKI